MSVILVAVLIFLVFGIYIPKKKRARLYQPNTSPVILREVFSDDDETRRNNVQNPKYLRYKDL